MANDFRECPTVTLMERWEVLRNKLSVIPPSEWDEGDSDALLEMRRELDRRKNEPKQIVYVNFAKDYLTD